jgi:hypothetical protein
MMHSYCITPSYVPRAGHSSNPSRHLTEHVQGDLMYEHVAVIGKEPVKKVAQIGPHLDKKRISVKDERFM